MFSTILGSFKLVLMIFTGVACLRAGGIMCIAIGVIDLLFAVLAFVGHCTMTVEEKNVFYDKIIDDDVDIDDL